MRLCMEERSQTVIVALYFDDFFIFYNDTCHVEKLKTARCSNIPTKDLGEVSECLCMRVTRTAVSVKLDRRAYCEKLLSKFEMLDCASAKTPIESGLLLRKSKDCPKAIGGLLYLSICTRPDIAYAVNYLSQFNYSYGKDRWHAVLRISGYLKETMEFGINYSKSENDVAGFCDPSFANDLEGRKSESGYVFKLSNGPISWESRKQGVLKRST
ncbi:uncharacterized protein LOC135225326 [Macrobrachium nipponense]|uniref:uncharacterized protein LOC135225326 n=1 Tax=Macrobrachium nipponense TaxID=159736 RepID=UPI0030C7DA21